MAPAQRYETPNSRPLDTSLTPLRSGTSLLHGIKSGQYDHLIR